VDVVVERTVVVDIRTVVEEETTVELGLSSWSSTSVVVDCGNAALRVSTPLREAVLLPPHEERASKVRHPTPRKTFNFEVLYGLRDIPKILVANGYQSIYTKNLHPSRQMWL
jgi:hypothetical protein